VYRVESEQSGIAHDTFCIHCQHRFFLQQAWFVNRLPFSVDTDEGRWSARRALCQCAGREMWMVAKTVAPLRRVVRALAELDAPPELAAGMTIGMIIGLVPKGNLIALSLCVLLFSLRVNKGLAITTAALFSCVNGVIDPFLHKVGLAVLSMHPLQASYACLFNMPLGPWIGFHNTVTSGALLVGLYVAYPFYFLTRIGLKRVLPSHSPAEPTAGNRIATSLEIVPSSRTAA
jgi:uncharacterized protein (TIGR03546 family)